MGLFISDSWFFFWEQEKDVFALDSSTKDDAISGTRDMIKKNNLKYCQTKHQKSL